MSDETGAFWTDSSGRRWSTAVNVNVARRVKDQLGVDLLDAFDGKLLGRLADDPVLLVDTLYLVCKPQADERDVDDTGFAELLVGDTIEQAASALVRGIVDFFPQDRGAVLERLWNATTQTRTQATRLATDKLDSPQMEAAMKTALTKAESEIDQRLTELGDTSGSLPESSVSIPAH